MGQKEGGRDVMNKTIRGAAKWEKEGKLQEELKCHLKREEGGKRGDN